MPSLSDRADGHGETRSIAAPRLLTELDPWHRVFLRNLGDLFLPKREPQVLLTARAAPFWPDVFVSGGLPGRTLAQSGLGHILFAVAVYGISVTWFPPRVGQANAFRNATITYYNVSEYLPPIASGSEPAKIARKGEPALAKQKIISLPRNPDNSRQTIIDPSTTRILHEDVRLPNLVAWNPVPAPVPMAGGTRDASRISLPAPDLSVIQPAPDARAAASRVALPAPSLDIVQAAPRPGGAARDVSKLNLPGAAADAVVPPPANATDATRKPGELNMAASLTSVAVPHLPVPEQRAASAGAGAGGDGVPAAPAPSGNGGAGREAAGRLIALGLDPAAINGPIPMPNGNRSGAFAAGPEGKPGAPGTPDIVAGGNGPGGQGSGPGGPGRGAAGDMPAGISVSGGPNTPGGVVPGGVPTVASPNSNSPGANGGRGARNDSSRTPLTASVTPSRVGDIPRESSPSAPAAKVEDQVFGTKKYYSMALNMPNLTSSGGSWIVNFAELNDSRVKGELTAPVPTLKVDPKYPPDLMASRVEGVVTLYAVIHSDGSVGEVRVLRGIDDRLDENARAALEHWQFRPATKNGAAVALEAVVQIPFKAFKIRY